MTTTSEGQRRRVTIANQRGLHARASAKFVGMVARLPEGTSVRVVREAFEAAGGSILGLMMLGAAKGDEIEIITFGPDAADALHQLCTLVEDRFGEE
ncbi:HPr family phosphocarrier protein [Croceicoccus ponticola]|uniref:HPr family phosphocarrier protein n=1 Tax=Croceicoccus ponticola TaxID=2217664 RepID=A0A437GVS7_9SPHN|nr:HPr family phosphocarrier protein [Croceicoccus ponticola]RVQ65952.1 HPr family phosphocarrier protein [Croceicoccus ponticola]